MHAVTTSDAVLSECRTYRYVLRRGWDSGEGQMAFIGLNPSTADEKANDPTVRRCISFAQAWGFRSMAMLNLFAYRATKPGDMRSAVDPVGPGNDEWILSVARESKLIVACWGVGCFNGRDRKVVKIIRGLPLRCFGLTAEGHPKHPLYLRKDATAVVEVPGWVAGLTRDADTPDIIRENVDGYF